MKTEIMVVTWFQIMYSCLLIPHSFIYNRGSYHVKDGHIITKVILAPVAILTIMYQLWISIYPVATPHNDPIVGALMKIQAVVYTGLVLTIYHAVIFRAAETAEILTDLNSFITNYFERPRPSNKAAQIFAMVFCMAAFLKSLHFVFFDGRVTILDGPKCFLQGIAREELSAALVAFSDKHQDGTEPWHVDGPKAILLGLFFFVMRISHALLWRMLCTLMTLWALLFWSALREAVKATAAAEDTSMLQKIQKFNELSSILDRFNRIYSWVTFFLVSCVAVYFSTEMIMKGEASVDGVHLQTKIANLLSGLDAALYMVASAMVDYSAAGIVNNLKGWYELNRMATWSQKSEQTTQGMLRILHQVETHRLGIIGGGLFTVTFSFTATVLSIICTYGMLVKQASSSKSV